MALLHLFLRSAILALVFGCHSIDALRNGILVTDYASSPFRSMVSIQLFTTHYCIGAISTERNIVTSKECADGLPRRLFLNALVNSPTIGINTIGTRIGLMPTPSCDDISGTCTYVPIKGQKDRIPNIPLLPIRSPSVNQICRYAGWNESDGLLYEDNNVDVFLKYGAGIQTRFTCGFIDPPITDGLCINSFSKVIYPCTEDGGSPLICGEGDGAFIGGFYQRQEHNICSNENLYAFSNGM